MGGAERERGLGQQETEGHPVREGIKVGERRWKEEGGRKGKGQSIPGCIAGLLLFLLPSTF